MTRPDWPITVFTVAVVDQSAYGALPVFWLGDTGDKRPVRGRSDPETIAEKHRADSIVRDSSVNWGGGGGGRGRGRGNKFSLVREGGLPLILVPSMRCLPPHRHRRPSSYVANFWIWILSSRQIPSSGLRPLCKPHAFMLSSLYLVHLKQTTNDRTVFSFSRSCTSLSLSLSLLSIPHRSLYYQLFLVVGYHSYCWSTILAMLSR